MEPIPPKIRPINRTDHLVAATERLLMPKTQPAPRRHSNKNDKAQGNTLDLRDVLEDKAKHARSIYGSRGRTTLRDDKRRAGYNYSGRAEHSRQSSFELRCDIA